MATSAAPEGERTRLTFLRGADYYRARVKAVNDLSDWAKEQSAEQFKAAVATMREQVQSGEKSLDDVFEP